MVLGRFLSFLELCAVGFSCAAYAQPQLKQDVAEVYGHRTVISDIPWDPASTPGSKVIYGTDDRRDVYQETDPSRLQMAASTCGLMDSSQLIDNGNDTYTIVTSAYEVSGIPACAGEPFANQPTAAFCTGFLVGDDLIATAGHCFDVSDINGVHFVFGFVMQDGTTPATVVSDSQVYTGVELAGWELSDALDYAIVRVDRPVTAPGAIPLPIRREGVVAVGAPVGVIGHPAGLPLKLAFGTQTAVYANSNAGYFVANLDTYGGNSGSPVFDPSTGVVEGILVRGAQDFEIVGSCFVSNELPDAAAGEEVSKSTTFMQYVPEIVTSAGQLQLNRLAYSCADMVQVVVVDADLAGSALVELSTTNGDTEPLTLAETGAGTGRFEGAMDVNTLAVATNNGLLNVATGAVITVTYNDANDGSGPAIVQRTANVDCAGPAISGVAITDIYGTQATVSFTTDELASAEARAGVACGDTSVVESSLGLSTSHSLVLTGLEPLTTYYVVVEATDAAGNAAFANNGNACFSFTTPEFSDYFAELFATGEGDLDNTMLHFSADGGDDYYSLCVQPTLVLPTDPTGGTPLALGDDAALLVILADGAHVQFFGQTYDRFFVGSNGFITFSVGDTQWAESYGSHFALPRISALFDDLSPGNGGLVSWKQLGDRVAVTFQGVPQYMTADLNTFQVELFFDGSITITHLDVSASDGLVGLSEGLGMPPDFVGSNLSAYLSCLDLDGDGLEYDAEIDAGTDPNDPDTDDDGLSDNEELIEYDTNPLVGDTDGDGDPDGIEVDLGTDPLDDASSLPISNYALVVLALMLSGAAIVRTGLAPQRVAQRPPHGSITFP